MPASLSRIVSLIRSGSAAELRAALDGGFDWPKDASRNPVFDLLSEARHTNAKQMPQKLEALLDHGLPVDFSLPFDATIGPSRQHIVRMGLPDAQNKGTSRPETLLDRAAALGLVPLIETLIHRGATDANGAAKAMAAKTGQLPALVALLRSSTVSSIQWGTWAPELLRRNRSKMDNAAMALVSDYLSTAIEAEGTGQVLGYLTSSHLSDRILQWLEHDPSVWPRLHDTPSAPMANGRIPSLWPTILTAHARSEYPMVFKQAIAHMRDRQPAWKDLPVGRVHHVRWTPDRTEDTHSTGLPGWSGYSTSLPPLQTLLHGSGLPKYRSSLRHFLRDARALERAGCRLWVNGGETGQPHTEQTLWALSGQHPSKRWLEKHPEFMLPHAQTGITPLHVARTTQTADHWIDCGADLLAVDATGNQAFATLVPMAGKYQAFSLSTGISNGVAWSAWMREGWKSRGFPLEGQAWGATIGELACCLSSLFSSLPAKVRKNLPRDGCGLHWAAMAGHFALIERLLSMGHQSSAIDGQGRTPLLCLAMGTSARWGGRSEDYFQKCAQIAIEHDWAEYAAHGANGPWQHLLQAELVPAALKNDKSSALALLFNHLKQKRIDNPELWRPYDTTLLLAWFQEENGPALMEQIITGLPQVILDDFLLALHDPDRWPSRMSRPFFAFGPKMVEVLLKHGADFEATSLNGLRLADTWDALEVSEQSTEGTEMAALMRKASLCHGMARAIMEKQRMEQCDKPAEARITRKKMRL